MDVLEWLVEVCSPSTGNPPVPGSGPGAATGPFGAGGPGPGPDKKPGPCDQMGTSPGPGDLAGDVATGVGSEAALDVAGDAAVKAGGTGMASGFLSLLGTLVSGSETAAQGYINIKCNEGRGLGGPSANWDAIEQEKANRRKLAEQMGH